MFNNLQMLGSASNRILFDKSNCWCHGHGHGHGPLVFMIITIWQDDQIIILSFDNHCIIRTSSWWFQPPLKFDIYLGRIFRGPQTFQSICIAPTALWEFFSYKEVWCALQAPRVHQISGGLMRFLWQKGEIPSFRRSPVTWCMHINVYQWLEFLLRDSLLADFSWNDICHLNLGDDPRKKQTTRKRHPCKQRKHTGRSG